MDEDLIKKVQGLSLSKTEEKIAEYILAHVNTIGFLTSTTLAEEIGVSDTSIIRFIRKLGFKGYAEFRAEMNNRTAQQIDQSQLGLSPGEKYTKTLKQINPNRLISDVSQYTFHNLQQTYAQLTQDSIDQVVDIILSSKRKYIAGFRGTSCCAKYMASKLVFLTSNVIPITHAEAAAVETLMDISEGDCLFLYSFPRYSEIGRVLVNIAKENGAKIILMTDRHTAPLAGCADAVVLAKIDGLGFTNSYVAPISLSEAILLAVSGRKDVTRSKRFNRIDQVMEKEKLY